MNSIIQNVHSSLPLLADSQKVFIVIKLIHIAVGFLAGFAALVLGF